VKVNNGLAAGTQITNQAILTGLNLPQPVVSNSVSTTVSTTVSTSLAGTWLAVPASGNAVSLTVDPQNRFTVWAVSANRQTVAHAAQGKLNPDGSFDVFSPDQQVVHFTGQIAADGKSATITAARAGFGMFSVTAPRVPDVGPLPNTLVGTFNGAGVAANGDQLQVRLSIDSGGNSTFEGDAIRANSNGALGQFGHFYVTSDGRLTDPGTNGEAGILQVQNGMLVLTYNYGAGSYHNRFQVPLQPLAP
jgi:hypothetical protein